MNDRYSINVSKKENEKDLMVGVKPIHRHFCLISLKASFFEEALLDLEDIKRRFPVEEGFKCTLREKTCYYSSFEDGEDEVNEEVLKSVIRSRGINYRLRVKSAERLTGCKVETEKQFDEIVSLIES